MEAMGKLSIAKPAKMDVTVAFQAPSATLKPLRELLALMRRRGEDLKSSINAVLKSQERCFRPYLDVYVA